MAAEVVWVDGKAYSVSDWARWHPGGDVLSEFIGKDATSAFYATHPASTHRMLHHRLVKGQTGTPAGADSGLTRAYLALHQSFEDRGWFECSSRGVWPHLMTCAVLLVLLHILPLPSAVRGIMLGLVVHQCAFPVHNIYHGGVHADKGVARKLGWLLGNVGFGVVGDSWDFEHVRHHAFTNDINTDLQQNNAPLITVDLLQLGPRKTAPPLLCSPRIERGFLRNSHSFWYIAAIWGGRFTLQINGIASGLQKRQPGQVLGLLLHYAWVSKVAGQAEGPYYGAFNAGPLFCALFALLTAGCLHVQLLVNHASLPMHAAADREGDEWVRWQAATTCDVANHPASDWLHGGLQFQIAHHLFPRLPAHKLREATPEVYAMLRAHGIPVLLRAGMLDAVQATCAHMTNVTKKAGLEPWLPMLGIRFWLAVHALLVLSTLHPNGGVGLAVVGAVVLLWALQVAAGFLPVGKGMRVRASSNTATVHVEEE